MKLFAFVMLCTCPSADVLTVGPPGSGAAYEQIQPAIHASSAGDTILVAAGDYDHFVLNEPRRLVGAGSDVVRVGQYPAFAPIEGLYPRKSSEVFDADGEVVVTGMEFRGSGFTWKVLLEQERAAPLEVWACDGTVVLQDVRVTAPVTSSSLLLEGALGVHFCENVWLIDCELRGQGTFDAPGPGGFDVSPGLFVEGSAVHLVGGTVEGGGGGEDASFVGAAHGLVASASDVWVSRTAIRGGVAEGSTTSGHGADLAAGSTFTSLGGPGTLLRGGDHLAGSGPPGAGLWLDESSATLAADANVVGGQHQVTLVTSPAIVERGGSTHVVDGLIHPTLASSGSPVAPGGQLVLELAGVPGAAAVPFLALGAGPPLELYGIGGALSVDLATLWFLPASSLDAAGQQSVPLTLPANPALSGVLFAAQWFAFGVVPAELSNLTTWTVSG